MPRYKSRREEKREGMGVEIMRLRKGLKRIREVLGLTLSAKLEDVIAAVEDLVDSKAEQSDSTEE